MTYFAQGGLSFLSGSLEGYLQVMAGWLAGYDDASANCGRRTWHSPARSVVSPPDRRVRLALSGIPPGRGGGGNGISARKTVS